MQKNLPNTTASSEVLNTKNLEALLEPILSKFRKRLNWNLPAFITFQQELVEDRKMSASIFDAVKMQTHKIAGSAKILGFEALGVSAAEVESCIDNMNSSEVDQKGPESLVAVFSNFLSNAIEAANAESATVEQKLYLPIPQKRAKHRVLIIDDDEFAREIVKLSLRNENCSFIEAETGMEGIKYLDTHEPDIVVLDVNLPDINGFEILKKVIGWEKKKSIPIVMLTREDGVNSRISGITGGATDYVTKPVSLDKLGKLLSANIKYDKSRYEVGTAYSRKEQAMMTMSRLEYY